MLFTGFTLKFSSYVTLPRHCATTRLFLSLGAWRLPDEPSPYPPRNHLIDCECVIFKQLSRRLPSPDISTVQHRIALNNAAVPSVQTRRLDPSLFPSRNDLDDLSFVNERTLRDSNTPMHGSTLVDPVRLAIPIETHRRLRIGGRRSILEAEGRIRHSQKKFLFFRATASPASSYRCSSADSSCGVARRERIQCQCECRQVFYPPT